MQKKKEKSTRQVERWEQIALEPKDSKRWELSVFPFHEVMNIKFSKLFRIHGYTNL
jgi:hypothetical protein